MLGYRGQTVHQEEPQDRLYHCGAVDRQVQRRGIHRRQLQGLRTPQQDEQAVPEVAKGGAATQRKC